MAIQRLENVGIVVDDLAAATTFFVELGLNVLGEGRSMAVGWTVAGARGRPRGRRDVGDFGRPSHGHST